MNRKSYDTVSEAVNDLIKRGYTTDFSLPANRNVLKCEVTQTELLPGEFTIDEIHRFEGQTDPGDEMIVFAISAKHKNMKGILVNAYGIYSDTKASGIIEHLNAHLQNNV